MYRSSGSCKLHLLPRLVTKVVAVEAPLTLLWHLLQMLQVVGLAVLYTFRSTLDNYESCEM